MKYILKFAWVSFVYIFIFLIELLRAVWLFDTEQLKTEWAEYRLQYANFMWKAFKINHF